MILQVILTPTHLAIVMEFASGGELFERICNAGRFSEDEVLIYFIVLVHVVVLDFVVMRRVLFYLLSRHGFSSNNLYQESATVMLWY